MSGDSLLLKKNNPEPVDASVNTCDVELDTKKIQKTKRIYKELDTLD